MFDTIICLALGVSTTVTVYHLFPHLTANQKFFGIIGLDATLVLAAGLVRFSS